MRVFSSYSVRKPTHPYFEKLNRKNSISFSTKENFRENIIFNSLGYQLREEKLVGLHCHYVTALKTNYWIVTTPTKMRVEAVEVAKVILSQVSLFKV